MGRAAPGRNPDLNLPVLGGLVDREYAMCHVLIIEDEMLAAVDIQGTLKPVGASSFAFADNEREALDEARKRRPDVIISDFMLIEGSGPAAVRAIRTELGDIPVIYVTAIPEHLEEGDDVLVVEKPFDQRQLIGLFRSVAPL